jgi:hypothetical protein
MPIQNYLTRTTKRLFKKNPHQKMFEKAAPKILHIILKLYVFTTKTLQTFFGAAFF